MILPTFETHPNAPIVINLFTLKGKRKIYNTNPRKAKYSSVSNAEWLLNIMNEFHGTPSRIYYIV